MALTILSNLHHVRGLYPRFWLSVMTELKNRGLQDIFIACCDGLKGFPDAIEAVYPHTRVQLCIVHQVRNSLRYVGWKERKDVAADLRTIYTATPEAAEDALDAFAARCEYARCAARDARGSVRGRAWPCWPVSRERRLR